jgi:WD40 repeat protein/serine/threonine protein kinase
MARAVVDGNQRGGGAGKSGGQTTMNPTREELLFQLALTKSAAERAEFLDRECGEDKALRARLNALLVAHDAPDELPSAPAVKATIKLDMSEAPDEAVGQTLGRYKLMERLGEGGCGVVYVAEQTVPVRRRVALKVIKLGMDTKAVVARFEAERQALAMMDHPNIAKVLDAGTTDVGRPFFVMELVRGIRITDYCDQNNLSTKERLELFIKICQAIQHAHQKGIIHRDIKPSNILVTLHDGVPVPKVIDFGIAKATEGRLTDATVYTQLHQFIGTPAYMSPEQAEMSGLDIDTRSDIYSLGVLLYELLAGSTPFDGKELMSLGIDAMRKTIREKEPVRPSTRFATLKGEDLTTTAKRRATDKSELMHDLKGDLDWIVMRCLEKDRTRRYDTATGLAADIKRHLNNEAVVARPPSTAYKFQKAFRRNKIVFAAGTAIAIALLFGIIASTWQSMRATRAKHEALAAKEQAVAAQASESVQRQKAEANAQQALAAQAEETKLRQQAEAAEHAARQRAYASDMNVAAQAFAGNNLGRALDLLNRQRPQPGQKDLRGWEWRYLWQQTRSDALFTLGQEASEVFSLAVSPDSSLLAAGMRDQGGLAVWDLRTRQVLTHLVNKEQVVRAAFSPTDPLLAITSYTVPASGPPQATLRLWNTATRQMVAELPLDAECMGLAFAKDGRTLVTATASGTKGKMTLWRMPVSTQLTNYPSQQYQFEVGTGFAATPDLSLAAYGAPDANGHARISVMDLHTGRELWTTVAAKVPLITALAFSPDGKTLASGAGFADSDIHLWDVATGRETGTLAGHGSWVSSLVFSPDGKKLTSSSADQTIRIWDMASQKCVDVLRGHRQEIWSLARLPDDKTLVSGGKDGTICFWDTSVAHPHQPRITVPAQNIINYNFAPDGHSLLTLDQRGQVAQWSGVDFSQQTSLLEMGTKIFSSDFSLDGRFLAFFGTNGTIQVWNPSQRVLLHQLTNDTGRVYGLNFLADGKKLMTVSMSDSVFHELDLTTGLEIQSWPAPASLILGWAVALTPDEHSFMAIGSSGAVFRNLVDQSQTKPDLNFLEPCGAIFSPDGKLLAVADQMGFARVLDAATWRTVATAGGFLNAPHGIWFSPDGKRLAIASDDNEAVRLCDTESWQDVFTLEAPGTGFGGVEFFPDNNTIAWVNQTTAYIWRAPSWAEINAAEAQEKAAVPQP